MKKKEMVRVISTLQNYVDKLEIENGKLRFYELRHTVACDKNEFLTDTLRGVLLELVALRESLPTLNLSELETEKAETYNRISGIIATIDNAFDSIWFEK